MIKLIFINLTISEDTTDLDDLLQEGLTDDEGRFELSGKETEITQIDPKLNVYHDFEFNRFKTFIDH